MQKRITKDLLTYLPGQALPALAAFITVPIYTHLFSPDQYGNYALAGAAVEFLVLGTATGFGQAAVRFFSAYQLKSSLSSYFFMLFGSVGLITLAVAAACAGILVIFRSLIPSDLYPLLWAALALFVVSACFSTLMDVLRGQEKSRWYTGFTIVASFSSIIFGLILVLVFRIGIGGLIWGQTLGLLLPIIPLVWFTTRSVTIRPAHLNRSDLKQLWAFALPFTIGNIAFWSLNLSDSYFVELFRGSYEVGLYSVANKISGRTVQLLVTLFFLVPAPMLSRLWEERGRQATEEALTAFTRIFFLMLIPTVVGLAIVAAPLIRLLADKAYFGGFPAIWLVACASMALGLSDLGSIGCMVTNRTRLIARNQIIAAVTNMILNLILIPAFGFMGAAWSTLLSFLLLAGLQAISSARFFTWRWPLKSLWRVLVASAAMAASVLLLQAGFRSDTTVWQAASLLLSIMVGVLIYGSVLWALGELSPQQLLDLFRADRRRVVTNPVTSETELK
ncbi:MAG: polysaccharide biosynthesis C-terminal domain-containing protein [Anaerolineales bacterium]